MYDVWIKVWFSFRSSQGYLILSASCLVNTHDRLYDCLSYTFRQMERVFALVLLPDNDKKGIMNDTIVEVEIMGARTGAS